VLLFEHSVVSVFLPDAGAKLETWKLANAILPQRLVSCEMLARSPQSRSLYCKPRS
jgi:hypothetical protein